MRLDVHRSRGRHDILLVNCQSDFLDHLATRFVVPLVRQGGDFDPVPRLNPRVRFGGVDWLFYPQLAASVPVAQVSERLGTLSGEYDAITRALDVLLTGF